MDRSTPLFDQLESCDLNQLVVFGLDEQRYALPLSCVVQIVRMVEITPLPEAPPIILGVVNFHGTIIPVFDLRKRFHLPDREPNLRDHLIIARTTGHLVALVADTALGVTACRGQGTTPSEEILPGIEYIEGVVKLVDGLIFIHKLETFLSLDEAASLEQALPKHR